MNKYRDGAQLPEWHDEVGEGWHPILERLHERLAQADPDYRAGTVKEKFGGLRVYLNTAETPEIQELIDVAELAAAETCEFCGAPGRRRGRSDKPWTWIKTCCDAHARERGYTD